MRKHRYIALTALFALVVSACSRRRRRPRRAAAAARGRVAATAASTERRARPPRPPAAEPRDAPLAPDPAEAVIPNVEPNAEISFWTFYLSPTFDQYIKDTIARFEATYPGVKVNWEDHQATFQDDLNNAFAAGNAPDVINLSVSEGWVTDYATQGPAPAASTARSRRPSRTSTSRASGTSSWSTARTSSSRGTRASASS